jgi:hypothetical protein
MPPPRVPKLHNCLGTINIHPAFVSWAGNSRRGVDLIRYTFLGRAVGVVFDVMMVTPMTFAGGG